MTFLTRKSLSRRTFLRGVGAALALPALDSMTPAFAASDKAGGGPVRLLFSYRPSGAIMSEWTPKGTGRDYEFSQILKPLEGFRNDITVLTGLGHHEAEPNGDGAGAHGRAGAAYLTGVRCKKTGGSDIHVGVSADQIAARRWESETRFPSLEWSCDDSRIVGACDSGLSCAYQNTLSWRTPTSPLPVETQPRVIFERLFGADNLSLSAADRARLAAERTSILDLVTEDTKRLEGNLGRADRLKIDEYLYSVREVEKQIQHAERTPHPDDVGMEKPSGVPLLFKAYMNLMWDMEILALRTDLTRVVTFMYGREASQRTYEEIGIPDPHHPLTHHAGRQEWIDKVTRINVYHSQLFAGFLGKLKETRDGDATLLDRSIIVHGSAISEGNGHSHLNLPTVLAGGGNGRLKRGEHIVYEGGAPMTNLFLSILDCMDVHPEILGDSTGRLGGITV